jgi:DNA replication protein DnaC
MRAAYDEIVTTGVKRSQGIERVIGALLQAEIAAKHARSIDYQMGLAKFPLAKELADLSFEGSPINGELVESLSSGAILDTQRNVVLIGGTGTGKSHIAIGIARSCIRRGRKARFFNVVDLVNRHEGEVKLAVRAVSPTASCASTSSSWTISATCRSRNRADNCCSTSSAASTSEHRSS